MQGPQEPAELIETHVSVITMIGDHAYKLLKPVAMGFLDHRSREDRRAACLRETEVNRRFAPDVYLGVLDVVDADGSPCDHLVAMRRMPDARRLSSLLDADEAPEQVRALARVVAGFHRAAPTSPRIAEAGSPETVLGLWEEGLGQLAAITPAVVPTQEVARAVELARAYVGGRRALLERRIADGRVRDGHGDLLADDVFCLPDGPRVLDCLAFADRLRHGDVLGDIAFLAMDLEAHGHAELGALLLRTWGEDLGEDHPASLAHHYVAYRAHVRSKVAALRSAQGGDPEAATRARALHAMSLDYLARAQVPLVLVGGPPGTGKSTVSRGIGEATGWPVIASDATRKELAGLPGTPAEPVGFEEGIYAPQVSDRVHQVMLERAAAHLALGQGVVLDASWGSAARRALARRTASWASSPLIEIRCELDPIVAAGRIAARRAAGEGPSDATPRIARRLAEEADPWPQALPLDTGRPQAVVIRAALRLVGPDAVR